MTPAEIRAAVSDRQAVIATLYGEARGESLTGMVGVASVIANRVAHPRWWGYGWRGVCLKPGQFSCWWSEDANTKEVYAVAEGLVMAQPLGDRTLLSELAWVVDGVMAHQLRDVSRGADSYMTAALYQSPAKPAWAKVPVVASFGSHVAFRVEL